MLKLTVTLIAVCLIASTEQRRFGKPWGKPNKFSCDSDNLPDFAASNFNFFNIRHALKYFYLYNY